VLRVGLTGVNYVMAVSLYRQSTYQDILI